MKRLGVIGTLVWDRIWHPSGGDQPAEQWGGIAYSLAALSAACPPGWVVDPIVRVGADLAPEASRFLSSLRHLAPGAAFSEVDEPNNRVELRYFDSAERTERLSGGVSGWSWPELSPRLEQLDALYINFISGYELDIETASRLRESSIPVYADLHSLFLDEPGELARVPRRLPSWKRWIGSFDAIQLNELELGLLGPERADRLALLSELPRLGPRLAIVTLGSQGASYASLGAPMLPHEWGRSRDHAAEVVTGNVPVVAPLAGDPTGCGDVWGSVLFAGLLAGFPLEGAIGRAHLAAGAKLREPKIEKLAAAVEAAVNGGGRRNEPRRGSR